MEEGKSFEGHLSSEKMSEEIKKDAISGQKDSSLEKQNPMSVA